MQDGEVHPGPPQDLFERQPHLHETSQSWMRIHGLNRDPLHFGRDGRHPFDDPERAFGVLYMAEDAHGAFIETFGRQLDVRSITPQQLSARALSSIQSSRSLRLIDLASSGGLARLGADGRLTSGAAGTSQRWSRAFWEHPIKADGFYYRLRHDLGLTCGVLFQPDAPLALREAAIRFEQYHRRRPLPQQAALQWADAAERVLVERESELGWAAVRPRTDRADRLLRELGAEPFLFIGRWSPAGLEQRLAGFAIALHSRSPTREVSPPSRGPPSTCWITASCAFRRPVPGVSRWPGGWLAGFTILP